MAEEEVNGRGGKGSDWAGAALLDKTREFFQTCDVEGKGFISRTDMRRLREELPLSAEQLEDVFQSLDTDRAGFLTLEAFSSRFSQFLHGRRISVTEDQSPASGPAAKAKETLYQSQWEARLWAGEDEEEGHFLLLLESLGAGNVFEDPGEVRRLWARLRRDEPQLLTNFEEFLARVTQQIKQAQREKREMESALQRKAATHNSEIRHLYEEMEAQIKNEKDQLLLEDSQRLQSRSQDLEHQLKSKERDLEQLFQKQKWLELQCSELSSEKQESRVENVKLKTSNEELCSALQSTSQELALAQEQLGLLQDQAARLQQEKEMEMYRVTEGLQRDKQSLMKQLDLLREINKHLKDERDVRSRTPRNSLRKKQKQRTGLADLFDDNKPAKKLPLSADGSFQSLEALPVELLQIVFVASSSCSEDDAPGSAEASDAPAFQKRPPVKKSSSFSNGTAAGVARPGLHDAKAKARKTPGKTAPAKKGKAREKPKRGEPEKRAGPEKGAGLEEEALDAPPDGWPLRRVISIEEDHLPHLLAAGAEPFLHQLSEEDDDGDESEAQSDAEPAVAMATDAAPPRPLTVPTGAPPKTESRHRRSKKKTPAFPRGQPVGRETQEKVKERELFAPDRLFKVVLVGNSSVGKTSLLRSFCEGRFHPAATATVGIDYSVKTLTLDNMQVAMQLWDTAGQERYRSITKQFFRKADGVVVMYDVTVQESFKAVKPWLLNVQEAAGEGVPVLLLGNKMDMEKEREVLLKDAERLASENKVMFFEVSAFTGKNVSESLSRLARVLMEQEDTVRDPTVVLTAPPIKKKNCCK
ncbi:EF-hand calcium-binding domain-containing protein 4B [Cololabis saira]|uniref:EF-hand calcium-binding domain-containing protein 4B n=1 Tax=Cololabis saira TaxID=129043 RepID=UPI002AD39001|nr:EF-hand calcium-binding domain-containing protein 4B [Cololabis saira]